ncbi:heat-inducible transcription repressor HrcA [Tessaracoccus bendigoensis DSM 12906]|uniref:Heat-inducible transcription repressor HrcA n=1 Tax=Tessaracoccus bendigoensis DSM 12906 TaxID=1123357 RepID=A0A1M6CZ57_9ACTN|nr:heat-inducible transcriptional repressor HrcA [Tessaracoccus bendigoensis]SHI66287.1 heat-inducible transcription repressor HrcA [Tessaracoccus bendigoensis DSM 12906]
MLDDRKLDVLKAIVTDYVASREPVGSKALVERHQLKVSAATVRNDMAALEEEGYITQPHTSAGRIPTDKGYRLFVDRLAQIKPLSQAERVAITSFMNGTADIDDLVGRTVRLLAQLTRQVAIVQYPVAQRDEVRHVDLVPLTLDRMLVIVVSSSGRVDQTMVEGPVLAEQSLTTLRQQVAAAVVGRSTADAATALSGFLDSMAPMDRAIIAPIIASVLETIAAKPAAHVLVAGVPNLAGAEFETNLRPLLEALEEQVVLMRLLGEAAGDDVTVRIGQENTTLGFHATSLVAAGYGSDLQASLGVVGPTRMDYPSTIAAVRAVARYVSRFLNEG